MRTFLVYWLPVVVWMALIFLMSTSRFSMTHTARFIEPILRLLFRRLSGERLTLAHMRIREGAHFAEYVILSLLLFRAVRGVSAEAWQAGWMWVSLSTASAYAVLDETHQKWEAGRTAKLKHVLIDIAGVVAAQALIFLCLGVFG